ncbi:DEAD/DEAH box helicase [Mumia sp. zg.B53]|uniref:DEAD/DEAH box helicase n=1 Tax=Mumia sp. zg.B53 TaxID=2855449 RepID=UPI001C6E642E|nr:DEAD/DEAH box helicase [Mumia sp. zg.B53]MBW9214009.1 DEAD/DEAH box helicase [Mumia sp. zg.B53]
MLTLDDLADEGLLRLHMDESTIERGRAYARGGYVIDLDVARNRDGYLLQSSVSGSGAASYQTVVSARLAPGQPVELYTACSCPVAHRCKHAVATVLVARDREAGSRELTAPETVAVAGPSWERVLDDLVADLDDDASPAEQRPVRAGQELALRLEVGPRRQTEWRFGHSTTDAVRPPLRLRPVTRGRRGSWVKTGVGWRDLVVADPRDGRFVPEHLDVLRAIHGTHRARFSYGFGSEDTLALAGLGASLWRLLREATEVGLPLVASGFADVRLASQPARLTMDAHADGAGGAVLAVGAEVGGLWVPAEDVTLLGSPEHGAALWEGTGEDATVVLAPLDRAPTPAVKELFATGRQVVVPRDGMDDLLHTYLPRVRRLVDVTSRDDSVAVPEPPAPHLVLALTWTGGHEAHLSWSWHYRNPTTGQTVRVFALDEEPAPYGMRDPDLERVALDRLVLDEDAATLLLRAGAAGPTPYPQLVLREMDAVRFAQDVLPGLRTNPAFEIQADGHQPEFREVLGKPEIQFTTAPAPSGRTDWLDLEVAVTIGGRQVGLATVIEAIATGQDKILLHQTERKGTYLYVSVDHPELDALARMIEDARAMSDRRRDAATMSVATQAFDLWDELDEIGVVDVQAARWVAMARRLVGSEGVPDVAAPTGLKATLRPYQQHGFSWLAFLAEHELGGILADDMGLGKTLQTLALITHRREVDPQAPPFLVVAPTSVVGTWANEAAAFAPDLVVRTVGESTARRKESLREVAEGADVVVTSYTLLRLEADDYAALDWAGRILDEAQAVKNHRGKTYQAVRRVDAPFSLAITGTPVENDLMELWSLLSLTAPGLFPHPAQFAKDVANPIEKGDDGELLALLRRRIRPILLRRTKDLVAADLPPKQEQVLEVTLSARHRKVYDTHLQRERQRILGLLEEAGDDEVALRRHRMTIFAALTKLRQLSLDPGLVDPSYDVIGSAKVELLVEHVLELAAEGHRALVFSQFTTFLRRVQARLEREGIATSYLDGSTRDRAGAIDGFKAGDQPVFLISLKAGGVGLTLTEADYVFVLDPWWNPAVEAQAVDRVHRIGQESPVMVYRLVSAGTIEEKVVELKSRKAELVASVLDEASSSSGELSADDLAGLFS